MNAASWHGIWPTMMTPFHEDSSLDEEGLRRLIDWYIAEGAHGLFAVCQSSEMFRLSLDERVRLAGLVVAHAAGRVPVIASGHIGESLPEQMEEIAAIWETGIDAFVLVSNRLAAEDEPDDVWIERFDRLMTAFPEVSFGIYECPYPYKRLLSQRVLQHCADSGRILFLKDTCCDEDMLRQRLRQLGDSRLKLFNANSTTLLFSLEQGAAGFSGVMANVHCRLYRRLYDGYRERPEQCRELQRYLTLASLTEHLAYPLNVKYAAVQKKLIAGYTGRTRHSGELTAHMKLVMDQLLAADRQALERFA